ncbi:MAG: hypothetical protein ACSHYF_11705 [Verrucomicrobiaceae bacterium]
MRTIFCGWAVSVCVAAATPSGFAKCDLQIVGEGESGVAFLRTVTTNPGSYFIHEVLKTFVEYEGEQQNGICIPHSKLELLHQKIVDDAGSGLRSVTEIAKNSDLSFADVLQKYPDRLRKWSKEEMAELRVHEASGVSYGRCDLVWGGTIKKELGFPKNGKIKWNLRDVYEGGKHLVLIAETPKTDESDDEEAAIVLNGDVLTQVKAHRAKADYYLVYAEGRSLEEVQESVEKKGVERRGLEIWNVYDGTNKGLWIAGKPVQGKNLTRVSTLRVSEKAGFEVGVISSDNFTTFVEVSE